MISLQCIFSWSQNSGSICLPQSLKTKEMMSFLFRLITAWIQKKKVAGFQPGLPGLTGFRRVNFPKGFYLDSDQSRLGSAGSRVDPPDRSGFQNYDLINCFFFFRMFFQVIMIIFLVHLLWLFFYHLIKIKSIYLI
jgi:hypothetical protein